MDTDPTLCLICHRRQVDDPYGIGERCDPACRDRLRELLDDLADWWPSLISPETLLPGSGGGGRRSPGFKSTPPLNLSVVALLAPRRGEVEQPSGADLIHPPSVVEGLADLVWAERGEEGPTGPGVWCARYLAVNASWIARQGWLGEVWPQLHAVHEQVRQVMPDPPGRVLVGRCPNLVDTGGRKCGTRLYRPVEGDLIRCGGCGDEWRRPQWFGLGERIEEAKAG